MQSNPRPDKARNKKKQQNADRNKKLANAAIVSMSALLIAGLGVAFIQEERAEARNSESVSTYTPPVAAEVEAKSETFTAVAPVVERLDDASKPWVLTVLGDSTGNDPNEWVHLVVTDLAERTGRPAVIHTWSIDSNEYDETTEISGEGEPIVVWNASASGKHTGYTLQHFGDMTSEASDLVVISHGHNQTNVQTTPDEMEFLVDQVLGKWKDAPALAVTLQNPRTDDESERQVEVVETFREDWGARRDVATIDVFNAFQESEDLSSLLREDGFHPNDAGEQVWADTVQQTLKLEGVGA